MLLIVLLVPRAAFGTPTHALLPGLDIAGFDKACGTAVDSQGDVYVSSAGESKIEVFDREHKPLASISDGEEPCGLGIDGKGDVYVTNVKTGSVVRYAPSVPYPFTGVPAYGTPSTIDSSGEARGLAVDPLEGSVYVAKGTRIDVYDAKGRLGADQVQRVLVMGATSGTYTLSFKGQTTSPLPYKATHAEVQAALEALSTIGPGNVTVSEGAGSQEGRDHRITFTGSLAHAEQEQLTCDVSGLVGSSPGCVREVMVTAFSGVIGEGSLVNATGVALYHYVSDRTNLNERSLYYVAAADSATNQVKIFTSLHKSEEGPLGENGGADIGPAVQRGTVDGSSTPDGTVGFGSAGAGIAADAGNEAGGECVAVGEQACTAGHFFVYDDLHGVVDEFDATGRYVTQIKLAETDPSFTDAKPTAIAVDRSGDANDGTVYVSGGAGAGAELLAYGPLLAPSRPPIADLSRALSQAGAVATDSSGDVYVASETKIYVYGRSGNQLAEIEDTQYPHGVAVDSGGNLYVADHGPVGSVGKESVTYYQPAVYPPAAGTKYTRHEPVLVKMSELSGEKLLQAIAVDPVDDHAFILVNAGILEFDSIAHKSTMLDEHFGSSLGLPNDMRSIGVYGANGDVYVASHAAASQTITVINASGTEVLAYINGTGAPDGPFYQFGPNPTIAVDQSTGHVLAFDPRRGAVEEFDASGAFVASFGNFTANGSTSWALAVDGSSGPSRGNVYVAYDEGTPETPDVWAFGPLAYGEPPIAVTGTPGGFGTGKATLTGAVDPRGFDVEACRFEYASDAAFQAKGFTGASQATCVPDAAKIGKGTEPVVVQADVSGLDSSERYDFRLVAENKYGADHGDTALFGPPVARTGRATPVSYLEAMLRGTADPSGLATRYWFEYGQDEAYGQKTPVGELRGSVGASALQAGVKGLGEGAVYHFRLVAESADGIVYGDDQMLATLVRRPAEQCTNGEYRTGLSANLPECRAYELVTPAETRGMTQLATGRTETGMSVPPVIVRGPGEGDVMTFFVPGTLPGFDGTGIFDGYGAQRGEGPHPADGWSTELVGPRYTQTGGHEPFQLGNSTDQQYAFWLIEPAVQQYEDTLPAGHYLRTPSGFEVLGRGSLGSDLNARSHYLTNGGTHVVFTSKAHLESLAPAAGTEAVYDRAAGASSADLISVKPDGSPFANGEDATYLGSSEDGSVVAFEVGGVLYVHREGATVEVAQAPNTFSGISQDDLRVFYTATRPSSSGIVPGTLYECDVQPGPCAGSGSHAPVQIAPQSRFEYISADGSHVYFSSESVLDDAHKGVAESENLYVWDGARIELVGVLYSADFVSFEESPLVKFARWSEALDAAINSGLGYLPLRATPDGRVLVFQSHAKLTDYDSEGAGEIYRYDSSAPAGERIVCVSCAPDGAPPSADAGFQTAEDSVAGGTTLISNATDDGQEVVFQSYDRLVPEDVNNTLDVYEWRSNGAGWCKRQGGCLALISSGQGDVDSSLFAMTADGHDIFFETREKLLASDVTGSPSIYDARVEGGIPSPPPPAPCQTDACQGQPSTPPSLELPVSAATGSGNVTLAKEPTADKKKALTRRQRLVRALKACRHVPKRQRRRCEKHALTRYGVKSVSAKRAATRTRTDRRTGK